MKKNVLAIAGSDPSGGAGAQADLSVFHSLGVRGLCALSALTAQNSSRVYSCEPVKPAFVVKQVEALLREFRIDAVKVGMTGSGANAKAIAALIKKHGLKNVVVDTILKSTSGYPLTDPGGLKELKRLISLCSIVTPNIPEASALTGIAIKGVPDMEEAARAIYGLGPKYVLIKGGHLKGAPVDVLYDGKVFSHYAGRRLRGDKGRFHGTGCILSSAIAAGLALGKPMGLAVQDARAHLNLALRMRR